MLKQRDAALAAVAAEGGTYGVLARFRLAETAMNAGDKAKARGILGEVASDASTDPGPARPRAASRPRCWNWKSASRKPPPIWSRT